LNFPLDNATIKGAIYPAEVYVIIEKSFKYNEQYIIL